MPPPSGGVFDTLLGLARHGLGGSAGHGRQFMSWIHYEDLIAAVRWLIDREDIEGVVNVAAPNPLPNAEFMWLYFTPFIHFRIGPVTVSSAVLGDITSEMWL